MSRDGDRPILAYGYRRRSSDLESLGAGKRVYIDHDRKRPERAQLLRDLRGGEVVRVLYLRDLGGAPKADEVWRQRIEARGATVEEMRPAKPVAVMGRPRKFDPTPEQEAAIRAVWLDEARSLADRCQGVIDIYGAKVPRAILYIRYGKPGAPK